MPSSYTSSLKLTLPQTGDLIGSWGGVVNTGVTSLVDQAVAGSVTITMTADTNYTLTSTNGASDEARNMFINVSGGPHTLTKNVVCPSVSKLYVVTNNTSGGQAILFKTSAGAGVTIPNGTRATVYCNGTNVTAVTMNGTTDTAVSYLTGSLALTSPDAGITTIADTAGFSGLSVFVDGTAKNTTIGMHGDTAIGTTAGVSNASLGLVTFDSASAGMIRTTAAAAPLYFATNAGVRLVIDDTGYTTLFGNGIEGGELRFNNPNNLSVGGYLDVAIADTFRLWTSRTNAAMQIGQIGAGLTGGTIGFYTEDAERVRITNTGNVGIGLSNPSEKLVVVGNTFISNTVAGGSVYTLIYNASSAANSSTQFALWNDNGFSINSVDFVFYSSSGSHSNAAANELRIRNGANAPMTFYTNNTERMRITGAGNVGIGTASPSVKLDVAGAIKATDDITTTGGVLVTAANDGVGYGTGAGGTVTQTPSITSAVTLNKPCGQIITDSQTWSSGSSYTFTFNNSLIAETDVLIVQLQSTPSNSSFLPNLEVRVYGLVAGSAKIRLQNNGGTYNSAIKLNFVLIKGVIA